LRFINSSQRALFRHPNEAFLYDLDGTLTDTKIMENYTRGGKTRGSSMVGTGTFLPNSCIPTNMSSRGTGGSICTGHIFRRVWHIPIKPASWIGKALCVRMPWQDTTNRCQNLKPECNCIPYNFVPVALDQYVPTVPASGNMFLAAEGFRYNLQVECLIGFYHETKFTYPLYTDGSS
jgi:hypothetical protein